MCRLRIPNGILKAWQFAGLADLAERYGGGYAHVTTRANLQIREIEADNAVAMVEGGPGSRPVLARLRRRQYPQRHRLADRGDRSAGAFRHAAASRANGTFTSSTIARSTACRASSTSPSTAAARSRRWRTPTTSASRPSPSMTALGSSRASGSALPRRHHRAIATSPAIPASCAARKMPAWSPTRSCASSSSTATAPTAPRRG